MSEKPLIVILGAGESGVGAAILAKDRGFRVLVSDSGGISPRYRQTLLDEEIPFEEGRHSIDTILTAAEVVKSPGIPDSAPVVRQIAQAGIPIISEIEFAGRYTDAKMVCITGSNGKTTTTSLIYHILRRAGIDAGLAGNIGNSLALQVARDPHPVYVIELSSFQLDNMYDFKADIAVLMNITPDHLDRYDYKFENYVSAKFRILQNQGASDAFIYWQDDPVIKAQLEKVEVEARAFPFAEHREEDTAAYVDAEDNLIINVPDGPWSMPRADLALHGLHNLFNSMAAALSASLLDIRRPDIRAALEDFTGVEHRLEPVETINGVQWINDSKATNVNSCWYALEAMTRPTVLILGGKDKGNDYSEILDLVNRKVKAIVAMGLHNEKIVDFFTANTSIPVVSTDNLADAVAHCERLASDGDTVLLSPCCASFDLFKSYEDRGRRFKDAVRSLKH